MKWKVLVAAIGLFAGLAVSSHAAIIARLEQATLEVDADSTAQPEGPVSAPIHEIIQAGFIQGGLFTNTYGMSSPLGTGQIRTVGMTQWTSMVGHASQYDTIRAPDEPDSHRIMAVFALDGYVESITDNIPVAVYVTGKLGFFKAGALNYQDPDAWLPVNVDRGADDPETWYDEHLIRWVLRDVTQPNRPVEVTEGQGELLGTIPSDEVNRSGIDPVMGEFELGTGQGTFLFTEESDPDDFLTVTTGHDSDFVGVPEEGLFVTSEQQAEVTFAFREDGDGHLTPSQQEVLNAISQWGLGTNFADDWYNPNDLFGSFTPIVDNFTLQGGDFFAQHKFLAHPILLGSVIPEPGTMVIWGVGLLGIGAVARVRRRRRK